MAMAPAQVVYPRHALPATAAFAVLAALAFDGGAGRFAISRAMQLATATIVLLRPLLASWSVTAGYATPAEIDRAARWIESTMPAGSRIATSLERFRLGEGYEVRFGPPVRRFPEAALTHFDAVVLVGSEALRSLTRCKEIARFTDVGNEGAALIIKKPCLGEGPTALTPVEVFPAGSEAAWDADPQTRAHFNKGAVRFGARFREPIEIIAIHLRTGEFAEDWPQQLRLSLKDPAGEWHEIDPGFMRPGQRRKQTPPFGQSYTVAGPKGGVLGIRFDRDRGGEFSVADVLVTRSPRPGAGVLTLK